MVNFGKCQVLNLVCLALKRVLKISYHLFDVGNELKLIIAKHGYTTLIIYDIIIDGILFDEELKTYNKIVYYLYVSLFNLHNNFFFLLCVW